MPPKRWKKKREEKVAGDIRDEPGIIYTRFMFLTKLNLENPTTEKKKASTSTEKEWGVGFEI